MFRHKRNIIIVTLVAITLSALIAIVYTEMNSHRAIRTLSEDLIQAESSQEGTLFNQDLREVERVTHELVSLVEGSFDLKAFQTTDNYMNQYVASLDESVHEKAQNARLTKSCYVFFLPELDQAPHDIWYADLDSNGQVERQSTFPLSYYDGDVKWKQWFYMPLATKKPFWTDPYIGTIESDQDVIYFSYTAPIIVEDKVIGIAGTDYYFNNMKTSLAQYSLKRKSETILVNKDFNVLIHPSISFGVNLFDYFTSIDSTYKKLVKTTTEGKIAYSTPNNQRKMLFYKQLDNGWYLLFSLNASDILEQQFGTEISLWVSLFIGLLFFLSGVYYVMRHMMMPVVHVREGLQNMLMNDFEQAISVHDMQCSDEFGELAKAAESLRLMWKEKYEQSRLNEEEMGALIEEKTLELTKTNEFLELSLAQLQEQNSEMNIATEKYEDQLSRIQLLQDRLFKSEQLASLSYILVGLAYDLNSPIGNSTTMISYLKSERSNLARKLQSEQLKKQDLTDFMAVLDESLELLERNMIIASNQVTQFKRLSSGQNHSVKNEFSLKETIRSIFNQSTSGNANQNIRMNLVIPDLTIFADQGAFIQVLSNLIRFSVSYSYQKTPKGIIAVRGEIIDESSLLMTYEDFGHNLPATALETAFVPYLTTQFQDQPQIVQLNICYNLITKVFEGSIRVESQTEMGNKFYMVLKVKIAKG